MIVQLIGFDYNLNPNWKVDIFKEVVNNSDADLIVFPGHTLRDEDDLEYLEPLLSNKKSLVVLELEGSLPNNCLYLNNSLHILRKGKFEDMYTGQLFATADDIDGNEVLMEKFFDEVKRRRLECCGKRITVLHCGETALLASSKAEGYKASFRFKENKALNRMYEDLMSSTDVFLNPIHDLQGEQGIMSQRRAVLSGEGKYYFSTCALNEEMEGKYNSKRIQYIYHDGKELSITPDIHPDEGYVSRIIDIQE